MKHIKQFNELFDNKFVALKSSDKDETIPIDKEVSFKVHNSKDEITRYDGKVVGNAKYKKVDVEITKQTSNFNNKEHKIGDVVLVYYGNITKGK